MMHALQTSIGTHPSCPVALMHAFQTSIGTHPYNPVALTPLPHSGCCLCPPGWARGAPADDPSQLSPADCAVTAGRLGAGAGCAAGAGNACCWSIPWGGHRGSPAGAAAGGRGGTEHRHWQGRTPRSCSSEGGSRLCGCHICGCSSRGHGGTCGVSGIVSTRVACGGSQGGPFSTASHLSSQAVLG